MNNGFSEPTIMRRGQYQYQLTDTNLLRLYLYSR